MNQGCEVVIAIPNSYTAMGVAASKACASNGHSLLLGGCTYGRELEADCRVVAEPRTIGLNTSNISKFIDKAHAAFGQVDVVILEPQVHSNFYPTASILSEAVEEALEFVSALLKHANKATPIHIVVLSSHFLDAISPAIAAYVVGLMATNKGNKIPEIFVTSLQVGRDNEVPPRDTTVTHILEMVNKISQCKNILPKSA